MSKMGLPYLPRTLVWTKISLDKYSPVYPTYLSKKFGHFGKKVCSYIYILLKPYVFGQNIILFYVFGANSLIPVRC